VPQIQQLRVEGSHSSAAESEVNPTQMNSALAHLKDHRLIAARLSLKHGLFHERVRVAAGDEVNSINLRRHHRIASLPIFVIAEVRHADDKRATFYIAQRLHHVASSNNRIDVGHAFEVVGRDQPHRTDTQTKQTDLYPADRFHNVTFHSLLEHGAFEVVVRRHYVE